VALERIEDVVAAVGRALPRARLKVYWICPMVEESKTADLAAVEER
jgi:ATP-dependent DNA helicase RecG